MRYTRILLVVLLAISVVGLHIAAQVAAPDVTGAWSVDLDPDFGGNPDTIGCTFKQDKQNVTGECGHVGEPQASFVGQVKNDTLTFEFKVGSKGEQTARFVATLGDRASTMKGEWRFVDDQGKDQAN